MPGLADALLGGALLLGAILDELLRTRAPSPGEHVVAMAFGPGLTLYTALLRARGAGVVRAR